VLVLELTGWTKTRPTRPLLRLLPPHPSLNNLSFSFKGRPCAYRDGSKNVRLQRVRLPLPPAVPERLGTSFVSSNWFRGISPPSPLLHPEDFATRTSYEGVDFPASTFCTTVARVWFPLAQRLKVARENFF